MLRTSDEQVVQIPVSAVAFEGVLALPPRAEGVVVFVHGSGSSRHSPRNTFVAQELRTAGLGTLLFDLLTKAEDIAYESRFDIDLLTRRLPAEKQLSIIPGATHLFEEPGALQAVARLAAQWFSRRLRRKRSEHP